MDEEDAILNWSVFSNEKKRNHQKRKQWSDKYFCCTFCCHSLLFVATRCSTRWQSFLLIVTRCTPCLSFFKRFFLYCFIKPKFCLLIHFPWVDVKSGRCLSGLSLISIILWEYCGTIWKCFDIILMRINEWSHENLQD